MDLATLISGHLRRLSHGLGSTPIGVQSTELRAPVRCLGKERLTLPLRALSQSPGDTPGIQAHSDRNVALKTEAIRAVSLL
jgi:hypothetical protein